MRRHNMRVCLGGRRGSGIMSGHVRVRGCFRERRGNDIAGAGVRAMAGSGQRV